MARNKEWLRTELKKILKDWDDIVLGGIVDAIADAEARADVDELVANFMDNDPAAVKIIDTFMGVAPAPPAPAAAPAGRAKPAVPITAAASAGDGMRLYRKQDNEGDEPLFGRGSASASPAKQPPQAAAASRITGGLGAQAVATAASAAPSSSTASDPQQGVGGSTGSDGKKVLGMFKQGGRLRPSPGPTTSAASIPASSSGAAKAGGHVAKGAAGGGRRDDQRLAVAAALERPVVNCLGCGKIFDCRSTSNDIIRFLDTGGVCTFCGKKVCLSHRQSADEEPTAAPTAAQPTAAATSAAAAAPADSATAAAVAFKNRLVDYDRNSAKRTTVIDDQSDFFEVDTNAWLTDKEREEMRARRAVEEAAEASRKRRVAVTIDLLGRRVLVDESSGGGQVGFATGDDPLAAPLASGAASAAGASGSCAQGAGGAGVAGGMAGDGGVLQTSIQSAQDIAEGVRRAAQALRKLRAVAAPTAASSDRPLPQFVGTLPAGASAPAAGRSKGGGGGGGARFTPAGAAGSGKAKGGAAGVASSQAAAAASSRLQYSIGEEFDEFGAQVLYEDVEAAVAASEAAAPFDLSPPELRGAPTSSSTSALLARSNQLPPAPKGPTQPLPPGCVLLKGWLSPAQQLQIVGMLRDLGLGPGGFYTPSYGPGQTMHLRMMCLGKHWEPRTHSYTDIRAYHDGARPPPLPQQLTDMCLAALKDASAKASERGSKMPGLTPDICLVNFYEKTGRLGMHQDKDETQESLSKQLPVVSFSLGDAADFLYGSTPDEAKAGSVRLESGDVLVFGGPARMIYHAVPRIYPHTAPSELLESSGLRPGRLNLTFRQWHAL